MRFLKRGQRIVFLSILLSIIFMIGWLLILPSAKLETLTYVIGGDISNKANTYLNNVSADDVVTLDVAQFEVTTEETKRVYIDYNGETYSVQVKFVAPNIKDVVKTTDNAQDFVAGGDYAMLFGIDKKYADKVSYSISSKDLKAGEQTVTVSLLGQSVTQKLNVFDSASAIGKLLQYDYKGQDLKTVVSTYLKDEQIKDSQVAFAYKNTVNGTTIKFNENDAMIAGSTYKLPLAMTVEDELSTRNYTLDTKLRVSTLYEDYSEYVSFIKNYGREVSIQNLLYETIVNSNNTSALTLLTQFGGLNTVYQTSFAKFGSNEQATIPTVSDRNNRTTAGYFLNVLDYLWQNKTKYPTVVNYLEQATPDGYYEMYLQQLQIWHKYGLYQSGMNDVAIVFEKQPYLIALFTDGLTSQQFGKLAYVINEWHSVNQGQ